ncbi:MAG: asparagine synthase (glutamine-hydrolyzing) [Thermomicrobiales bacterium]|nr:MAG: asparagine synthase (glutamine-hydrolyzing) [Thermomicrobiales bacterium]
MCGIAGMVGPESAERVCVMTRALVHRGPDDVGYYHDPSSTVSLGMQRLSILDLEHGHQPMANQDQSVWIVYNGEIFNSPELRRRLEQKQHRFVTAHSDTETLLRLYDEKQEDMLGDLNGMFAFVLHDKRRNLLFGARDRMGIKPLYYANTPGGFAFASELKSLLTVPILARHLDRASLFHYLTLRFVPGTSSMVKGVSRLAPGHWFRYELDSGKFETQRYWRPSFAPQQGRSAGEWSELVRTELRAAVQRWSLSDVPIGCSLSGGLDSSSIVGLLAESGHSKLKTYSLGFEGAADLDELPLARQVAERWGTDHHELILRPDDLLRDLLNMVWFLDEPYGGGLPSWYVFQFMHRDVKVGMTGTGGDELFGDYGRYIGLERQSAGREGTAASQAPGWLESCWPLVSSLIDRLPHGIGGLRSRERWRHWPQIGRDPFQWEYVQAFYYFSDAMKRKEVLAGGDDGGSVDTTEFLRSLYEESDGVLPRDGLMQLAMRTQLPEEFLFMTDRFSMAHSLEARVPFLDQQFVDLMLRIPAGIRTKPEDPKYLLRQAVRDLLPGELLHAPKRGFVIPTAQWLRGPLRPLTERLLAPARLDDQGLFRPEFYERFVGPHLRGQADYHPQIWTLLMFQIWHSLYIERTFTQCPSFSWQELC